MKAGIIITHLITFLAGWLCISSDESSSGKINTSIADRSPKHRSSHTHLARENRALSRAVLDTLASTPMEARKRNQLKRQIIADWAKRDPMGVLDYMALRKWTSSYWTDIQPGKAFEQLAITQPEILLRYALENGCGSALNSLASQGNPHVVFQLFLEQKEHPIPASYYLDLFEAGTGKDPQFYEKIVQIKDKETRTFAFIGAGRMLLETNREQDYLTCFHAIHSTVLVKPIIEDFAESVIADGRDITLFSALPEEFQQQAADVSFNRIVEQGTYDNTDRMKILDTYIEKQWIQPHLESAAELIKINADQYYSDEKIDAKFARAWHDWALSIPDEPDLKKLQQTAIQRWIIHAPAEWKDIAQLPSQSLRDAAYTAAISGINFEKELVTPNWIINQISNESYRSAAQKIFAEGQNPDDDPFTGRIDLYNPLAEPQD